MTLMPAGDNDPDLELLLAETQVLWGVDSLGRYAGPPLCAVAISAAGHHVLIRPDLDADLAESLRHVLGSWALALPAHELRLALTSALPLLEAAGITAEVHGGPSFLVESLPAVPAGKTVVDSTTPGDVRSAGTHRPPGWDRTRWDALLSGALGPWAMVLGQGEVLSLCHTTRESAAGAVADIWTDPRSGGTEDATVTTAAWAGLMRQRDSRSLFCSAADSDDSAQEAAARLGLRPIGWIWTLHTI
jgi:hypothetical protein